MQWGNYWALASRLECLCTAIKDPAWHNDFPHSPNKARWGERKKENGKIGHNCETAEAGRDYLISTANREESASSFNYEDTSFAFNDDSTLGNQTETYAFSESDSIGQTIATTSISDSEEIPTDAASIDNLIAEHTETVFFNLHQA